LLHTQYRARGGIILLLTQVFHQPRNPMESAKPKEAVHLLLRRYRAGVPMVVYTRVVENISVSGCQDPAFSRLVGALRRWFPVDPSR
jgi:hypothetical protein